MPNESTLQRTFYSVGDVASKLGVPTHRVQYTIGRSGIQATARGGRARLFDDEAVAKIEAELKRTAARVAESRRVPR